MTRLEAIRKWDSKKMAWWIEDMYLCCICNAGYGGGKFEHTCDKDCIKHIAEWLDSEDTGTY